MTAPASAPFAAAGPASRAAFPRWMWLTLAVLFVAEFLLFDQVGARRFTPVHPRWNDQVQYLSEAYQGYEYAKAHGFFAGLWRTLTNPSAQGTLHDAAALIVFKLSGPSRSAALSLNILALIAWQAALLAGVWRATRFAPLAFASVALPLLLVGPWSDVPGSAYDFRLDHLAMCGIGICGALALTTDGFRARGGSILWGAVVGLTLLARFLTGTYFALIFLGFGIWLLTQREARSKRIGHLLLAALAATIVAAPLFWLNREWVWNYYWIGHYVGPESAIRNQHFGLGRSLVFIGSELGGRHLGTAFGIFTLIFSFQFWLSRIRFSAVPGAAAPSTLLPNSRVSLWATGAIFFAAPALILTLHQQKSEVVVGALAPGVVLLLLALWHSLMGETRAPVQARARTVISAALVFVALLFFARYQFKAAPHLDRDAINRVNTVADQILKRSRAANLERPRVGVDYITDCLDAQILRVLCYERHRTYVDFDMTLPISIAEPQEAEVFARLARSDFVFVTEEAPAGQYPFDQKLAALRPAIHAWCDKNLRAVDRFPLYGRRMVLYQRREIPLP